MSVTLSNSVLNASFAYAVDSVEATGTMSAANSVVTAAAGDITGLGSFTYTYSNGSGAYKLAPADIDSADDTAAAAKAIVEALNAALAVETPEISGTTPFESSTEVTISVPHRAAVYYTLDGSTPTDASTAYAEALTLDDTTTVKAIAIRDGVSSEVASETFEKSAAAPDDNDGGDS